MKREWLLALVMLMPAPVPERPATQHTSHTRSGTRTASPAWLALRQSMERMHRAMMSIETSRDSDVDFVRLMLPHHQAAIDMAKIELSHGTDPQMHRLAQEIITDQQSEIELMQLWLKQHAPSAKPAQDHRW
jgi:uncharacterized protein (DUF305 family)